MNNVLTCADQPRYARKLPNVLDEMDGVLAQKDLNHVRTSEHKEVPANISQYLHICTFAHCSALHLV